jgi:hypothetical protein
VISRVSGESEANAAKAIINANAGRLSFVSFIHNPRNCDCAEIRRASGDTMLNGDLFPLLHNLRILCEGIQTVVVGIGLAATL